MTPVNLEYLATFLDQRAGLVFTPDKSYLAESRLNPIARRLGHASLDALLDVLRSGRSPTLEASVVEAMTTNETSFFRDKTPFERLRKQILPQIMEARAVSRRLNIWCAASSSGQEPYSLAMMLAEMKDELDGWFTEILATDIAPGMIEKSKAGIYSQFEVQRGLPIQLLVKYFSQEGESWRLNADLRGMVRHQVYNLLDDYSSFCQFDVIFCRNVLIYFNQERRLYVLDKLARCLAPGGVLILGSAETLIGVTDKLKSIAGESGMFHVAEAAAVEPQGLKKAAV